jgi:hypothetical protein
VLIIKPANRHETKKYKYTHKTLSKQKQHGREKQYESNTRVEARNSEKKQHREADTKMPQMSVEFVLKT